MGSNSAKGDRKGRCVNNSRGKTSKNCCSVTLARGCASSLSSNIQDSLRDNYGIICPVRVEVRDNNTIISGDVSIKSSLIAARDLGVDSLSGSEASASGSSGARVVGRIAGTRPKLYFRKRYRGRKRVSCVLGASAMRVVKAGLNRGLENLREATRVKVENVPVSSPCCGNEYTIAGNEVECHQKCALAGTEGGLVDLDLLAYLAPYAVFQKRSANLVGVLKGRALIWRRRQMKSEHCFAHALPGTIAKALEMSDEEIRALRAIGKMPDAVMDVYEDGIEPNNLTSWWRRGGTEPIVRSSWLFGSLKVGR